MSSDDLIRGRQRVHQRVEVLATSLELQLLLSDGVDQRTDLLKLLPRLDVPAPPPPTQASHSATHYYYSHN